MKINGGGDTKSVRANGAKRAPSNANGAGFANHLGQSDVASPTETATGPGSVAALLAVQAAGDPLEGRRQAYDRGEAILKRLDGLHMALLDGRVDDDALIKLSAELAQTMSAPSDPALSELLAEIELRAAVELAKRGLN